MNAANATRPAPELSGNGPRAIDLFAGIDREANQKYRLLQVFRLTARFGLPASYAAAIAPFVYGELAP